MLSGKFLADFKRATEARWSAASINPAVCGFQFQRGTRWNLGLLEQEISDYESALGLVFPRDFKDFLAAMNGTDLPTLNVYGYSGEPFRESVGVYSYPRDLPIIQELAQRVTRERGEITATLAEEGFELSEDADFAPICGHRYVLCARDPHRSVVLSIQSGGDAIVYGKSLKEYLEREFL